MQPHDGFLILLFPFLITIAFTALAIFVRLSVGFTCAAMSAVDPAKAAVRPTQHRCAGEGLASLGVRVG